MTYDYVKGSAALETAADYGRKALLSALTHDDRGSLYQLAERTRAECGGKLWVEPRMIGAKNLINYGFAERHDCYVSVNGFTSRKGRAAENCRQVNCLLFDIDFHKDPKFAYVWIEILIGVLLKACLVGEMPTPTFVVNTGCGVQLYYILDRSIPVKKAKGARNAVALRYLDDVETRMDGVLAGVLKRNGIEGEVDGGVHDLSRVARVPGTINSRNGEICKVVAKPGGYVTLASMSDILPEKKTMKAKPKKCCCRMRYDHLAMSRMSSLERLRDRRGADAVGSRESMSFLYYNSAVQVYASRDEARRLLYAFNSRIAEPLDPKELKGIIRSVDKVGFYRYSRQKIAEKLCLDDAEYAFFFRSKRDMERSQAKEETALRKAERDRRIYELYAKGCYTQGEVANLVGCCEKTVRNVLNGSYQRQRAAGSKSCMYDAIVERQEPKEVKNWQTVLKGVADGCMTPESFCENGAGVYSGSGGRALRVSIGGLAYANGRVLDVIRGLANQCEPIEPSPAASSFAGDTSRPACASCLRSAYGRKDSRGSVHEALLAESRIDRGRYGPCLSA